MTSPYDGTTPVPVVAGPGGIVTLVEGRTFAISGRTGDIAPDLPHGVFVLDTRVLSEWELRIDRHAVEPLAVDLHEPFSATFVSRARPREGQADADVVVFRHRSVGFHTRERIEITNHGLEAVTLVVDLVCDVDFADLFDVKQGRLRERGRRAPERSRRSVRHTLVEGGVERVVEVTFDVPAAAVDHETLTWVPTVAPGSTWGLTADLAVALGGHVLQDDERPPPGQVARRRSSSWRASLPTLETGHPALARAVERSGADLGSLLLSDPDHPDDLVPAAGAPWFMTLFGRDSLLTGWMTLLFDRTVARGTLRALARLQGTGDDAATEEEPGKILHEVRYAGAGGHSLGHGDVYYGSIDASPLFVVLLGELLRWDDDDEAVRRLVPHADRALDWVEERGDRDGDGFVEYQRASDAGLANQGWKDSWDAVRHPGGRLAEGPIALCEVQGYVYAAHRARAALASALGDEPTRARHEALAAEVQARFDDAFWLPEEGTYALALDGRKEAVAAVSSNVGHCLWSGIVPPARAGAVVERLLADDMWSGWGIRTLATSMRAYNPVSYHNGSVWPHDNALCAAGLARYGFREEAHRVIEAQLEVADVHDGRLPELFTGFARRTVRQPAAYPTSCSPQAWAAAAPLLWLRTLLGVDADDGPVARPASAPAPAWLGDLALHGVHARGETLTLRTAGPDRPGADRGRGTFDPAAGPPGGGHSG